MSYTTRDADKAWKLTPEQEQKILTLTSTDEISAYIRQCGLDNGVVQQLSGAHPGTLVDVPQSAQPAADEIKQVTINGQVVRGTQTEIDSVMRAAFTTQQQHDDQPARGSDGRFKKETQRTAEQDAAAVAERAELDLQFKRGAIDTAEYLEKTGAIAEALERQLGVPISAIAETFQEQAGRIYEQSWREASDKFKQSPEGRTWPGGEANKQKLGEVMTTTELDGVLLAELPDKIQALRLAYEYMQENKLIVENTDIKQEREETLKKQIAAAKTPEEITKILGIDDRRVARQTSAQWGKQ